jgi:beta-lactam-binding protein with PASTA domain
VISQAPAAGVQVGLWSAVSFIVSLGPLNSTATITVPNIVGLQQYLAQSTLAAAGCAPGTVTYQTSLSVAAGLVISQSVTGAGQPAGVQVNYVVSLGNPGPLLNPPNGPPLVSVPDLTT